MSAQTDIAADLTRILGAKSDLKTSIEGKGVTVPSATKIDGYAALVDQIQQGGGGNPIADENDVIFIDYDGTIRYSYSASDFANLTELPANPTHTGLTAQGWNWTLADAKSYVASYGGLCIGQNYVTDDGKTRAYISLIAPRLTVPIWIQQSVASGVTIDWGDGTTETPTATTYLNLTHTYAAGGDYVIKFTVSSGNLILGPYNPFIPSTGGNNGLFCYPTALKKVELGTGITNIGNYSPTQSYYGLSALETITIPTGATALSVNGFAGTRIKAIVLPPSFTSLLGNSLNYATQCIFLSLPKQFTTLTRLQNTHSLRRLYLPPSLSSMTTYLDSNGYALTVLVIPSGVSSLPTGAFSTCNIEQLTIPDTVTTIGASAFAQNRALVYLSIGTSITDIGAMTFATCTSLGEIHIKATTPPTITADTFASLPADCTIYVPSASLAAYQGATNWSTYASQMVGE